MKKILFFLLIALPFVIYNCGTDSKPDESSEQEASENNTHEEETDPDHTVLTLKRQKFALVVRTGGSIMASNKDIVVVAAKSSGIVQFFDTFLMPGVIVGENQALFTISGRNLADDNTDLRFIHIKADLEKAFLNYERAKSLIADRLITQEHFLEAKNEYEKIETEYENLKDTYGDTGNIIFSASAGYVMEIFVREGQMITTGDPLASIIKEKNLVLKADLSPDYLDILPSIKKANFRVAYNSKIFKTSEMNGKQISFGKSVGENSFYIPLYFRLDYDPQLIVGTYAEVYLIGKETDNVLVVPNSALMEEFGKIYVFVEDEEGDFIKRYIMTGFNNGEFTEVVDGLAENETIVATGANNIKLALMSTTVSAPTHNH